MSSVCQRSHLVPRRLACVAACTLVLVLGEHGAGAGRLAPPAAQRGEAAPVTCSVDLQAWRRRPLLGINLAGPAFTPKALPGEYGKDFIYPSPSDLAYWHGQGVHLVRLMFQWERLQPRLGEPFDEAELGRLEAALAAGDRLGLSLIVGPHNYARYNVDGTPRLIGSLQVPVAAFKDLWQRLAARLKERPSVFAYSLMNEPHDTGGTWHRSAQAGLDAIRSIDRERLVMVPGDDWSSALRWQRSNADLLLADPSRCVMYDAHLYFDRNGSGFYQQGYDETGAHASIGSERVRPFLEWLERHGQAGIITEFGIPQGDPRWLAVLDDFLRTIARAGVGGTYWAAGPWWGDYPLSIEPRGGRPAPAMSVLGRHLTGGASPSRR